MGSGLASLRSIENIPAPGKAPNVAIRKPTQPRTASARKRSDGLTTETPPERCASSCPIASLRRPNGGRPPGRRSEAMGQDEAHLSGGVSVVRPSLRFLALAVLGWVGFRMATLGALPGAGIFSIERSEAKPPPIVQTEFPEIAPVAPVQEPAPSYPVVSAAAYGPAYPQPLVIPVYYQYQGAVSAPVTPAGYTPIVAMRGAQFSSIPQRDEWPVRSFAAASMPPTRPAAPSPTPPLIEPRRLDRLQLTMWVMLRQQGMIAVPHSLASSGTLGGSQAGARLFYNVSPQLAAVLRSSSDVGRRGGELALGIRVQPLRSLPIWVTAERRHALGLPARRLCAGGSRGSQEP